LPAPQQRAAVALTSLINGTLLLIGLCTSRRTPRSRGRHANSSQMLGLEVGVVHKNWLPWQRPSTDRKTNFRSFVHSHSSTIPANWVQGRSQSIMFGGLELHQNITLLCLPVFHNIVILLFLFFGVFVCIIACTSTSSVAACSILAFPMFLWLLACFFSSGG